MTQCGEKIFGIQRLYKLSQLKRYERLIDFYHRETSAKHLIYYLGPTLMFSSHMTHQIYSWFSVHLT